MSRAPVDVLAHLDAEIASHRALSADAYHVQQLPKAEAVRAAVAELIDKADNAARVLHNVIQAGQIGAGYQANLDELRAALARVRP